MIRRLAVPVAVALSAALAVPASAKSVCLQIVDASGDGGPVGGAVAPLNRDSLDILSGDVATGKKNLVGALRLKSVAPDSLLVGGAVFAVKFVADGAEHAMTYRTYATGEKEATFSIGIGSTAPTTVVDAVVDTSTATITWYVPRKLVPALKKPNAKLSSLTATSAVGNNVRAPSGNFQGSSGADLASAGGKTYTDMTPTCLKGA
jgi:hypothetical protein